LELAKAFDAVGVNKAVIAADPRSIGTQSHVAVVATATAASQPTMEVPFNMKLTVPARDVVAVIRSVVAYCGDELANARFREVDP
jgi:hypothetical protein